VHTYAFQLVAHFQSPDLEDARFETFLEEMRQVSKRHGISIDDHQSMRLMGDEFRIGSCDRCLHLTVSREDVDHETQKILPDFWFHVRRGSVSNEVALCDMCEPHFSET